MATVLGSRRLFWLLFGATSFGVVLGRLGTDFRSDPAAESLVLRTILCALPWLVAAFVASSLARLWPAPGTRWLLANRRYVAIAFAAGMAWHFAFGGDFMWKIGNRLTPRDLALDLTGRSFLLALTATSLPTFRSRLSPSDWRRLHTTGIYTL